MRSPKSPLFGSFTDEEIGSSYKDLKDLLHPKELDEAPDMTQVVFRPRHKRHEILPVRSPWSTSVGFVFPHMPIEEIQNNSSLDAFLDLDTHVSCRAIKGHGSWYSSKRF
jgi:hypothetical protein